MRGLGKCLGLTISALLICLGCFADVAYAELTQEQFQATKKILSKYNDQPSMDTTPVVVDIVGVKYKIPRNYIIYMSEWNGDPGLIKLRVTFPGFQPLNDATKDCLTKPAAYRPAGCVPVDFILQGHGADDDERHFKNGSRLFRSQIPKVGPNGFEMYETGSDNTGNARMETYHKKLADHTLLFNCFMHDNNGKRSGICDNGTSTTPDGTGLFLGINYNQLKDVEQIDQGIRKLVKSLAIEGGTQ